MSKTWVYKEELRADFSSISEEETHTIVAGIPNDYSISGHLTDLNRQRENANLIVLAPIMLDALKDFKRYLEEGAIKTRDDRDFCIQKIDDILNKVV